MDIRNEKDIERILETVNFEWKLSLLEEKVLTSVLNLLLARKIKELTNIQDLLNKDWDELLELIPDSEIQCYAERDLDMVDDERTKKFL